MGFFSVPPESFLFNEDDLKESGSTCHLAIVGQDYIDIDYWVLGDTFLQNYYVVFNAEGDSHPRVGITLEKGSLGTIGVNDHMTLVLVIAITMVVLLVGIFCALIILYLCKKREKKRGKHMSDLINRKRKLENEEESSDEEEK